MNATCDKTQSLGSQFSPRVAWFPFLQIFSSFNLTAVESIELQSHTIPVKAPFLIILITTSIVLEKKGKKK